MSCGDDAGGKHRLRNDLNLAVWFNVHRAQSAYRSLEPRRPAQLKKKEIGELQPPSVHSPVGNEEVRSCASGDGARRPVMADGISGFLVDRGGCGTCSEWTGVLRQTVKA